MEKKETATAHPLGMCEKLYNAFINRPSLLPLRRPRLTSGTNSHVAEGHNHLGNIKSQPSAAEIGDQLKAAAAVPMPKEVPSTEKERVAIKPPEPAPPQPPKVQLRDTNIVPSVTKEPTRQVTAPEKEKAQLVQPALPEQKGREPTSILRLATDKGKTAPPAVSPPPPAVAAVQGKTAPPPAVAPPVAAVQVKAPPVVPPIAAATLAAPPTVVAAGQGKAVSTEKDKTASARDVERAKAAQSATNINEKSENFIRRAKNSLRSATIIGGTRKES